MDTLEIGDLAPAALSPLEIQAVGLVVRDLDRVERFYRDVVGLGVISRSATAVELGAGGRAFLELSHRPEASPGDPAAAGLYHIAFLLPSRADLGRWLAHAESLGLQLDGAADHLVSEAVYLRDPEGNGIEIYADRAREEWQWTEGPSGRRIKMANSRLDKGGLLALAGPPWKSAPAGTRIGHVHLRVGDVAVATRFYAGSDGMAGPIGMDVTASWDSAVFLSTGGYHHHLAANSWDSAGAGPRDPNSTGLAFVALAAADDDVLAAIARRSGSADLGGKGLRDPWGTLLRFVASKQS